MPANYEICEVCKPYLDSGEEIPVSLLAKLIKFHLMAIKMADLQQQELEKKVFECLLLYIHLYKSMKKFYKPYEAVKPLTQTSK